MDNNVLEYQIFKAIKDIRNKIENLKSVSKIYFNVHTQPLQVDIYMTDLFYINKVRSKIVFKFSKMPSKYETLNALGDAQGHSPRLENRSIPTKANTEAHLCSKKKAFFRIKSSCQDLTEYLITN